MPFRIYNTLTGKKEIFTPRHPPQVKMYCCGPTVYDFLHIGNFRGAVFYNFLRLWLEHKGFVVSYAYNFTDVDDKILARAKKENTSMKAIADTYISEFKKDFQALKLKEHDHNPQATHYISAMQGLISKLIQNKKAYELDGDVFYHVPAFEGYGDLSKKKGEELLSGARVEVDARKKDPRDFALWKKAKAEEPGWDSPWGRGRPGWHIECTTMIQQLFGAGIDIHGGGADLIFPHHENERAQAEGSKALGAGGVEEPGEVCGFVKYWVHNNMFTFGGEKMAKSTGNQRLMRRFLESYNGEIFKYLVLSSHYRSMIEVSHSKILQCIQALARVYSFLKTADGLLKGSGAGAKKEKPLPASVPVPVQKLWGEIQTALDDDLNTPSALAVLFAGVRRFNHLQNKCSNDLARLREAAGNLYMLFKRCGGVMGLFQEEPEEFLKSLDDIFLRENNIKRDDIDKLVLERSQAAK